MLAERYEPSQNESRIAELSARDSSQTLHKQLIFLQLPHSRVKHFFSSALHFFISHPPGVWGRASIGTAGESGSAPASPRPSRTPGPRSAPCPPTLHQPELKAGC